MSQCWVMGETRENGSEASSGDKLFAGKAIRETPTLSVTWKTKGELSFMKGDGWTGKRKL